MGRTKSCTLVLFIVLSAGLALAQNAPKRKRWTSETFPNPNKDFGRCGRPVKSSICDPDSILTNEQQNMVDGLVNEIARGSSPFRKAECGSAGDQGFQVAVAVFHRMSTAKGEDKAVAAQRFARALHDQWGVGSPDCQNGALLLLAVGDKQAYISTGRGIKAVVSDAQLLGVLDAIKPSLKHKRYADAILSCVQQLGLLMSGQQPEPGGVDADDGFGIFMFFLASVAGVMGWAWFSNHKRSKRYKACADKLAAIKRDQAAIRSQQYAASSCPICLEDFDTPLSAAGAAAAARAAASGRVPAPAPPSPSAPAGSADPSSSRGPGAGLAAAGGSSATRRAAAAAGGAAGDDIEEAEGEGSVAASAPLLGGGAGAGPSSSSAAAGSASRDKKSDGRSESRKEGRKPLILRCGHAFCDPCITKWLESHTNCPICRKDLDASDDQPSSSNMDSSSRQPGQQQQQQQQQADGDSCARGQQVRQEDVLARQVWLPELGFRLRRLRLMYPDFVTDPMLYAWEEDLAADRDMDTSTVAVMDPARQQQLEESGRGGASTFASFGGGNSGGGGGAGTSW